MFTVGIFCRKMYIIGHGTNRLDLGRRHRPWSSQVETVIEMC